jgi:hypothetical protein
MLRLTFGMSCRRVACELAADTSLLLLLPLPPLLLSCSLAAALCRRLTSLARRRGHPGASARLPAWTAGVYTHMCLRAAAAMCVPAVVARARA